MRLKDRVAIVTGGAQGIGREYCLRFAREGASVVVADLRVDQAKAVEAEIAELGGQALAIEADVADEASVEAMARQTHERFGRIDALVNNAAIYYNLDLGNETVDYLRKVLDVNVIGILIASRAVFPYMKEQGGRIDHQHRLDCRLLAARGTAPATISPPTPMDFPSLASSFSPSRWRSRAAATAFASTLLPPASPCRRPPRKLSPTPSWTP